MYKLILVSLFLVSCNSLEDKPNDQYECINYVTDKGVSFTDALQVCNYKFKGE